MRKLIIGTVVVALAAIPAMPPGGANARPAGEAGTDTFVVVFTEGTSLEASRAAVAAAGGTIVSENTDVGVATVSTANANFVVTANEQGAIEGVAHNQVIGEVPHDVAADGTVKKVDDVEDVGRAAVNAAAAKRGPKQPKAEPLADLQWDMKQIGATADGSYKYGQGSDQVLVGIIDTGVDGTHPDIAPNFDAALSRNFTHDIPVDADGNTVDGPCEVPTCVDPANEDDDGHGTHVASTIASPINGIGIAGVAPKVKIVNLRAGQDSGYFFLQPSVDALTYAGDNGIDVVNMSYYVDPWLFNCADNPADSPEDQAEQRTIVTAMQRALDYARRHGVTLVSAAGNGATDYTKVIVDESSPDYVSVPGEAPYDRTIPPSCISMPSEGNGVISVSSTGPSLRKAYYSDYGNGYVDVAAPGGDAYDTPDGRLSVDGLVLAAYPESLAIASGDVDVATGEPTTPFVVRDCAKGTCAYYQYLQGTSMASPHAAGVAALIVSKYGIRDRTHGGLTLDPRAVDLLMRVTATRTPCPVPATFTYTRFPVSAPQGVVTTATCEGNTWQNGFYGHGVVSALRVVKPF
ncbi:MAG: peptidase [Ilumatobacteraceae bacterium]|nr:peptidase [Ilumatobacteraceae bacterium]